MAPSRRKGASKAAAAAAARRKWNIGDLVLAKVKGFPAWPAMVSEPEKWGFTADARKVHVFFFGTQQIAFCNPVDVEEFTEEKKESLLVKRHGKGADFARALNEIIDCYEKLKKEEKVVSVISAERTIAANGNNSEESLGKADSNSPKVLAKSPLPAGATDDLNCLTDAAVAAAEQDASHDEDIRMEEVSTNMVAIETPVSTYSTRSKGEVSKPRNTVHRRASVRRFRSSSRIEASRTTQSITLTSDNNKRSSRFVDTNALRDRSLRRSKRIMKSPDDSDGHAAESPAYASNESNEENDSEIASVESDVNDSGTLDSGSKPTQEDHMAGDHEGERELELNDRLDFQSNAIVVKKKRKPNRKRQCNNAAELEVKPDELAAEFDMHRAEHALPGNNEKLAETYMKDDGDEHLPLVKRARVRMEKLSPKQEQHSTLVVNKEKTSDVLKIQSTGSLDHPKNSSRDLDFACTEGDATPLPHTSPANNPRIWDAKKNSLDVEAALPPLKRLHRALEAMSANVAEDFQNTLVNGYNSTSSRNSSAFSMQSKMVNGCEAVQMENHVSDDSHCGAPESCARSNLEVLQNNGESHPVVPDCNKTSTIVDSSKAEWCPDSVKSMEGADSKCLNVDSVSMDGADGKCLNVDSVKSMDGADGKCLNVDSVKSMEGAISKPLNVESIKDSTAEARIEEMKPRLVSPKHGERLDNSDCSNSLPHQVTNTSDHVKTECSEFDKSFPRHAPDTSRKIPEAINIGSSQIYTKICIKSEDVKGCRSSKMSYISSSGSEKDNQMCKDVKEAGPVAIDTKSKPSETPVKVVISDHHQLPCPSNSASDDHLEDKAVSVTRSSSLTDGLDSVARPSPPSSSVCNTSASDNNVMENNSCSSPDVQLHLEKAKLASKSSGKSDADVVLASFESVLGSLTRTKESIGRATRIAIDCAKFGYATKVLEILARNLENESSLHKKVDLFFLVDSITQCSRGMKGNGGIYPSAILALLPRLLLAAAPPNSSSRENHRQCLKVLRVWQERKILPEPIIRPHIRELDSLCGSYAMGSSSRRPLRNERAFDDPIREMEGMMVDEYGSNSSIQLPGFSMPPMLKDEDGGSDSDGESFEAVTPEHNNAEILDGQKTPAPAAEKRSHILEEVDGELEMEDAAPSCDAEISSTGNIGPDNAQMSRHQHDNHFRGTYPPLPKTVPPISPPPPRSTPPSHPPPPPAFPPAMPDPLSDGSGSKHYPSSQPHKEKFMESDGQSNMSRFNPRSDAAHRDNRDFEGHMSGRMPACSSSHSFSSRSTSHTSNNSNQRADGTFNKAFHLRPPHPSPSNQFSYVHDQWPQSRRDIPPPSYSSRFDQRDAEHGNFHRDRGRMKYPPRDSIGECWRPPLPSISGPCYPDVGRMPHPPGSYSGPPREPPNSSRWPLPPRPMNHRQYVPYRPPSEGPIPVSNRGLNYWRPR